MKLTNYTDYSLRVLYYLAVKPDKGLSSIKEIASAYDISENHLMKIIHHLGKLGLVKTVRGRNGGVTMAKEPKDINLREVVTQMEEDFFIVECFNPRKKENCVLETASCGLKRVFAKAANAFLAELEKYTLQDVLDDQQLPHMLFSTRQKPTSKF